jgi:hypothetical protein
LTYDFERPFVDATSIPLYEALDMKVSARYGRTVRATSLSNIEYKLRFNRFGVTNNMKAPPSCGRIFPGYPVIRNLGSPDQYETWIPEDAFEEIYALANEQAGGGHQ